MLLERLRSTQLTTPLSVESWGVAATVGVAAGLLARGQQPGTWVFILIVFSAACVGVFQQTIP